MITIKLEDKSLLPTNYQIRPSIIYSSILLNWQPGTRYDVWRPPTDLFETDNSIVARVEIAGVKEDDFIITIDHNILLIGGTRIDDAGHRAFHQIEVPFGEFGVQIPIPIAIDTDKAFAKYQDGFLYVVMPIVFLNQSYNNHE